MIQERWIEGVEELMRWGWEKEVVGERGKVDREGNGSRRADERCLEQEDDKHGRSIT